MHRLSGGPQSLKARFSFWRSSGSVGPATTPSRGSSSRSRSSSSSYYLGTLHRHHQLRHRMLLHQHLAARLRHCGRTKSLAEGRRLHQEILDSGLGADPFLGNLLLQMYGSCGQLADAHLVFDSLVQPNVYSWNLLMAAHTQNGDPEGAKAVFDAMPSRDAVSWNGLLSSTSDAAAATVAFRLIPQRDGFSWNALLAAFSRAGRLSDAGGVFGAMPCRDVVSWTTMLCAYAANDDVRAARRVFEAMACRDAVCWNAMITATSADQLFHEMPQRNSGSWNALLQALCYAGRLAEAWEVMARTPCWCLASWNSLVQAAGDEQQALEAFELMPSRDLVSWNTLLGICSNRDWAVTAFDMMPAWDVVSWNALIASADAEDARDIFWIAPQRDLVSWNSMVACLGEAGDVAAAAHCFSAMPQRDVVTWNAMLAGCARQGQWLEAMDAFATMPTRNLVSWNSLLYSFAVSAAANGAQAWTAAEIFLGRLPGWDETSWNLVLLAFSKAAMAAEARRVFDDMAAGSRTHLSWGALVAAYAAADETAAAEAALSVAPLHSAPAWNSVVHAHTAAGQMIQAEAAFRTAAAGSGAESSPWNAMAASWLGAGDPAAAIRLLAEMDVSGVTPDVASFVIGLDACGCLAEPMLGKLLHDELVHRRLQSGPRVGTALVVMYSKCGLSAAALEAFEGVKKGRRNQVCWSALLEAEGRGGGRQSSLLLYEMVLNGVMPDAVTFVHLLAAWSHGGGVEEGRDCFLTMVGDFELVPSFDHFACMVDVLARSGRVAEAYELVVTMPFEPDAVVWSSLVLAQSMMLSSSGRRRASRFAIVSQQFDELSDDSSNNS